MMNIVILIMFIPLPLFDLGVASRIVIEYYTIFLRFLHGKDVK